MDVAPAGGTHDVQEVVPQELTLVLLAQVVPQAWLPALQVTPQAVPLQVAVPFSGVVHGVHALPQVARSALLTQAPPHR